ncbi:MAG: hypothetical protein ACRCY9_09890 [Phycicoccus sp.]
MEQRPESPGAGHDVTPREAREQLERAATAATRRRVTDRRVHGLATAGFGVVVGGYVAMTNATNATGWETPVQVVFILALGGLAAWQTRASRVVPRGARRTMWAGMAGTMALALATNVALRHPSARPSAEPTGEPWWVLGAAAIGVALPMLAAGRVILRQGRR